MDEKWCILISFLTGCVLVLLPKPEEKLPDNYWEKLRQEIEQMEYNIKQRKKKK